MGYKFNPFTGSLDIDSNLNLTNPLQFQGLISANSDFPTSAAVQNGWFYIIDTDVTDDDPTKTNTGQSFQSKDEIVWNGTNWTVLGNTKDVDYIDFDLTTSIEAAEGRLVWNDDEGTLNLGMPGGNVNLQIGQENLVRVTNDEVDTITNGTVVYINGASGANPKVKRANNNVKAESHGVIGLATEDIESGQKGYVTRFGLVRDLDTSSFDVGDSVFLDTNGSFTNVIPGAPLHVVEIGKVVQKSGDEGSIFVDLNIYGDLVELSDVNGTPLTTNGQLLVWDNDNSYFDFNYNINDLATSTIISSNYLKLDCSNDPLTGNLEISKADPEIRLTDSGNDEYTRLVKSDTDNEFILINKINVGVDTETDQIPTMTSNTSPSGIASASSNYGGSDPWKAMNDVIGGGTQSWASGSTSLPQWLKYDFGAGNGKTIGSYSMTSRTDSYYYQAPGGWVFQGSNNDVDWVDLDTRSGIIFGQGETKEFDFSNSTSYRYYRLYITTTRGGGSSGHVAITEFELFLAPGESSEATIINSRNSQVEGEKGIQTFGDEDGRTVIEGQSTCFNNNGSEIFQIDSSGDLVFPDNYSVYFGTGKDASIYYDGTNFKFDSQESGSGDFVFNNGGVTLIRAQQASTRESLFKARLDGNEVDNFFIVNGTSGDTNFAPTFSGLHSTTDSLYSLNFRGFTTAANDASDSSDYGLINFEPLRTTIATNPNNGTLSGVQYRKIFTVRDPFNGTYFQIDADKTIKLPNDNQKLILGAGDDASVYYDGTDLNINPRESGTGDLNINGSIINADTDFPIETTLNVAGTAGLRTGIMLYRDTNYSGGTTNNDDGIGLGFNLKNSANSYNQYSAIYGGIEDKTSGSESGFLKFAVENDNGGLTSNVRMHITSYGDVFINSVSEDQARLILSGNTTSTDTEVAAVAFRNGGDNFAQITSNTGSATDEGNIEFYTQPDSGTGTVKRMEITGDGDIKIPADDKKLMFGEGSDASIYYDGTDLNIKTDEVAVSDLKISCGTDKTLELVESVWDDIQFSISSGRVAAANYPDWDSTFTTNTGEYKFDVNDYIDLGSQEMAHWWKEGTVVYPHIHTALDGANSSGGSYYAKFTVYFAYADEGTVWTETTDTIEIEIPDGTADLTHLFGSGTGFDLTGCTIGTQIKVRLKRIAATSGDEYPNHIFVTQCGIHAEKNTLGSRQVGTK